MLGRIKETIQTASGSPCVPRDVEDALEAHARRVRGGARVHPCGAGEMVVAVVHAAGDGALAADELHAHLEAFGLPCSARPEVIRVSAAALPCVGEKVDKRALREREMATMVTSQHSFLVPDVDPAANRP